jgi:hypothetical protein
VPTGRNGSLRLAISAKASSPASSSMYLRVRPGVDTGRRAAQAGCGVTPTALDKGKRSPPSSYGPSSHGRDWYRAGASALAPAVASPPLRPLYQEQPKRREARRGAEGGNALPHRLPPAPQPGRRPQAPSLSRLTGILRSASYSRNRSFGRGSRAYRTTSVAGRVPSSLTRRPARRRLCIEHRLVVGRHLLAPVKT